jgi:hypothetical protein
MRVQTSLFGAINQFREEAQLFAVKGDQAALCALYGDFALEAQVANSADAAWYLEQLKALFDRYSNAEPDSLERNREANAPALPGGWRIGNPAFSHRSGIKRLGGGLVGHVA